MVRLYDILSELAEGNEVFTTLKDLSVKRGVSVPRVSILVQNLQNLGCIQTTKTSSGTKFVLVKPPVNFVSVAEFKQLQDKLRKLEANVELLMSLI